MVNLKMFSCINSRFMLEIWESFDQNRELEMPLLIISHSQQIIDN